MRQHKWTWFFLCTVLAVGLGLNLVPAPARASGFGLFEQGAKAMGMGGAFTATADDPSAIFFNPAGLAFQEGLQVYFGATLIVPSADFEGSNPYPGEGVREQLKSRLFFPPTFYLTYRAHEYVAVGVGVFSAFGLATEWENPASFTGRYISTKAEIQSFSINPVIAIRVSDRFAIGGGLEIRSTDVTLERYVDFFDPFTFRVIDAATVSLQSDTAWSVGFNAGFLYKVTDQLRIGFSYRHHMTPDLTGKANFNVIPTGNPQLDALLQANIPAQPARATSTLFYPKLLSLGVAVEPWETWLFEIDVNWAEWSRFQKLDLVFPDNPALSGEVEQDFDDTFNIRFGVQKQLNDQWTLRAGFVYDQNPKPIETVDPILPDADRYGVNLGISVRLGNWRIDATEMVLFFESRDTTGSKNLLGYFGRYTQFANLFGLSLGYHF